MFRCCFPGPGFWPAKIRRGRDHQYRVTGGQRFARERERERRLQSDDWQRDELVAGRNGQRIVGITCTFTSTNRAHAVSAIAGYTRLQFGWDPFNQCTTISLENSSSHWVRAAVDCRGSLALASEMIIYDAHLSPIPFGPEAFALRQSDRCV